MIDQMFIFNFFVFMSSFVPVIAVLLPPVKQLNSRKAVCLVQSLTFGFFLYVLLFFPYIISKTVPSMISLYPLFLFLFNLIFLLKFRVKNFSKIFSVSLMLTFVLTELHELPAFAYSYLTLGFLDPQKWIFFLSPFAAVVFFLLAAKTFHLSLSARSTVMLLLSLAGISVFYVINPRIDFNTIPSVLAYVKRFYCFVLLAAVFLIGGNPRDE